MWPTARCSQGEKQAVRAQPAHLFFASPLLATMASPEYQQLPHVWMFIYDKRVQWALLLVLCQPAVGHHFKVNTNRDPPKGQTTASLVVKLCWENLDQLKRPGRRNKPTWMHKLSLKPPRGRSSQIFAHLLLWLFSKTLHQLLIYSGLMPHC